MADQQQHDDTNVDLDDIPLTALHGKVVIITGGSSGIGLASTRLLATHGAHVLVGDVAPPPSPIAGATFQRADVREWAELVALFETAVARYGRVDVVVANAGIRPKADYMRLALDGAGRPLEPTAATLHVNLLACINTAALALHYMRQPTGSIILTASAASYLPFGATDYTAAKHGVLGFMRALLPNLAVEQQDQQQDQQPQQQRRIRVNALAPGWTETNISSATPAVLAAVGAATQSADVVARCVALLSVDESRHGQVLYSSRGRCREIDAAVVEAGRAAMRFEPGEESIDVHWERLYERTRRGEEGARAGPGGGKSGGGS